MEIRRSFLMLLFLFRLYIYLFMHTVKFKVWRNFRGFYRLKLVSIFKKYQKVKSLKILFKIQIKHKKWGVHKKCLSLPLFWKMAVKLKKKFKYTVLGKEVKFSVNLIVSEFPMVAILRH